MKIYLQILISTVTLNNYFFQNHLHKITGKSIFPNYFTEFLFHKITLQTTSNQCFWKITCTQITSFHTKITFTLKLDENVKSDIQNDKIKWNYRNEWNMSSYDDNKKMKLLEWQKYENYDQNDLNDYFNWWW